MVYVFIPCAVVVAIVAIINFIFSKKSVAMRLMYAIYSAVGCEFALLTPSLYDSMAPRFLPFNFSETYAYIFSILLSLCTFLLPSVLQIVQAFKKTEFKFNHFFVLLISQGALFMILYINCVEFNDRFEFLSVFMPVYFAVSILLCSTAILDVADKKQFITLEITNLIICSVFVAMLVLTVYSARMFTIFSIVMSVILAVLIAISIALPIVARRSAK